MYTKYISTGTRIRYIQTLNPYNGAEKIGFFALSCTWLWPNKVIMKHYILIRSTSKLHIAKRVTDRLYTVECIQVKRGISHRYTVCTAYANTRSKRLLRLGLGLALGECAN